MAIEQGKLGRLNDTNINVDNLSDGKSLVYNGISGKWEPKEIIGGGTGILGLPSDGSWEDGAIKFQSTDTVVDAIDDLNEVLGELVPEDAQSISTAELNTTNDKYTLSIVNGLGEGWDGVTGTTRSDITDIKQHNLVFNNNDKVFNNADKGILKLYINGELKAKIDLGANFNEANRKNSQNIDEYNTAGEGDPIVKGVVTFTDGKFKILSVGKYNGFSKWQKGNAIAEFTNAKFGKNEYQIGHEINGVELKSPKTVFYCYNNFNRTAEISSLENTVTGKYVSGVKYYTIGDKFDINITGTDFFKSVYKKDNIMTYSISGLNWVVIKQDTVPTLDDSFNYNETVSLNKQNVISDSKQISYCVTPLYGYAMDENEITLNYLFNTYGTLSTKISESFVDEKYRLPLDFNFDDKTSSIVDNWDSTQELQNGNAMLYIKNSKPALTYPIHNFTNFHPGQTANYSTFTGEQVYIRAFEGENKGNATFTLTGLSDLNDVKIEIKLPGMSGWGNALLPYDSAADKTQDGWGMLQGSASKTSFTATFGGLNTADTNGRIYVRITLLNQNASLQGISVGW